MWPSEAAKCNGVRPIEEPVSFPTPESISTRTTSKCPFAAAKCNGVSRKKLVGFSLKKRYFGGHRQAVGHQPALPSKPTTVAWKSMIDSDVFPTEIVPENRGEAVFLGISSSQVPMFH